MAGFLEDDFTDTDGTLLSAHVPTVTGSGAWTKDSAYAGTATITSNRVYGSATTYVYYHSADPIGAEYDVTVLMEAVTEAKELGPIARKQSGADTHYLFWYNYDRSGGAGWQMYAVVNGTATAIGSSSAAFPGTGSPKTVYLRLHCYNASKVGSWSTDGSTFTSVLTSGDNSITGKGLAGLRGIGTGSSDAALQATHLLAEGSSAVFTLAPTWILQNSTGNAITLTGTNTTWSSGTPGSPTFTLTGGTGASITAQTVASATSATLTISAGSATGTLTITDPASGYTQTITVIATVAVSNTHFQAGLSPYNWYYHSGSGYVRSTNPGAYLKFGFTGTQLALEIDTSSLSGLTTANYPKLRVSIDNAVTTDHQLPASGKNLLLASGLSSGSHTALIYYAFDSDTADKWTNPYECVKITNLGVDAGGALEAASGTIALKTRKVILYGDSITRGNNSTGTSGNQLTKGDAWWIFGRFLAEALDAEVGIVGYGGQGYVAAGASNVPALGTAWDDYSNGLTRLDGSGLFTPVPFAVISCHGTNDRGQTDGAVQSAVEARIAAWRTAAGADAWIFICDNPGRWKASALAAAVAAAGDSKCEYIPVPASIANGLGNSGANLNTLDGLHPNTYAHARYAAALAEGIGECIGAATVPPAGGSGVSRGRVIGGY
jgi:lysophospholipase L1-like esterase